MAAKMLVFAVLIALAAAAPQAPIHHAPHGIPFSEYDPNTPFSYEYQINDPVTGAVTGEVKVQRGDISKDYVADSGAYSGKLAGIHGGYPSVYDQQHYNPYLYKQAAAPYSGYYPHGYNGHLGHQGYLNHPNFPKYPVNHPNFPKFPVGY